MEEIQNKYMKLPISIRLLKSASMMQLYFLFLVGSSMAFFLGEFILELISMFKIDTPKPIPTSEKVIENSGFFWAFFGMIIWSPIVEEFSFRYWLCYCRTKVVISLSAFTALVFVWAFHFHSYWLYIFSNLVIFCLLYKIFNRVKYVIPLNTTMSNNSLIYLSAFVFSLLHLSNYDLAIHNWYLYVPYIITQLFGGVFFGYLRVIRGFSYALCIHSLGNLTSFTAAYFF
ncbi:MAG: CPBP family intramembrane metalloprotease [Cytophagia bacterium]|nr:MAG: CPBP family intramembrane metalloprotease [Runella sp.]TAG21650.1 MAG: CPBP family intramembrane metalloprotease [Cytophagales bacterium]TAG41042.1 MAG: CPBP family intramembrane metalloprotease [Cytophagia bacterium]TAG83835.1 MAG: CPBP family intramembrane metalloprotease [Cytophagales bacterium]